MILEAGLAVEIDMHPDSDFKARLAKEDEFVERFADFWSRSQNAMHRWILTVFYEILNEPEVPTPIAGTAWKRSCRGHSTLRSPEYDHRRRRRWDNDDDLVPRAAARYQRHLCFPFLRAAHLHASGRDLGSVLLELVKGLHYPSSPENAAQVATLVPEARDRMQVIRYGRTTGTPPASKRRSIRRRIGPSSAACR